MVTSFRLDCAKELNADVINAIKSAFTSKPIIITVQSDEEYELSEDIRALLDQRI